MQSLCEESLRQTLVRCVDEDGCVFVRIGGVSRQWHHLADHLLQDACIARFPSLKGVKHTLGKATTWRELYCRRYWAKPPAFSQTKVVVPSHSDFLLCVEIKMMLRSKGTASKVFVFAETLELTDEMCLKHPVPEIKRTPHAASVLVFFLRVIAVHKSDGEMIALDGGHWLRHSSMQLHPESGSGCAEWHQGVEPRCVLDHACFIKAAVRFDYRYPQDGSPIICVSRVEVRNGSNGRPLLQCIAEGAGPRALMVLFD